MFDIRQSIFDRNGELDEALAHGYVEGLAEEFARSPEARSAGGPDGAGGWAAMMMEYGINYLGSTPRDMTPADFDEILFGLFPRKVSVGADEAGPIVAELRAFWDFVGRQYGVSKARPILGVLDDRAAGRLRDKLADPSIFGMAKSFFMLGSKSGFDMTTPEGLAAFQLAYNASLSGGRPGPRLPDPRLAGPDLGLPAAERPSGDALKKKRKEKRRQREAKKRNRPR